MLPGRNDTEMGPANPLHTSEYHSENNERFDYLRFFASWGCLYSKLRTSKLITFQEGTDVTFANQPGSISYSQIALPASGSLELTYNIRQTNSVGIVYVSLTVTNPGLAFYDFRFEVNVVRILFLLFLCYNAIF